MIKHCNKGVYGTGLNNISTRVIVEIWNILHKSHIHGWIRKYTGQSKRIFKKLFTSLKKAQEFHEDSWPAPHRLLIVNPPPCATLFTFSSLWPQFWRLQILKYKISIYRTSFADPDPYNFPGSGSISNSRSGFVSHSRGPDPYQIEKHDPDPDRYQSENLYRIQIRTKRVCIRNTVPYIHVNFKF
jgi:hypothetical protein